MARKVCGENTGGRMTIIKIQWRSRARLCLGYPRFNPPGRGHYRLIAL